jgi:hypothetical protein
MEELLKELEKLRSTWNDFATGIEITHGDDDPGAKAYRSCNRALINVVESWKEAQGLNK